jgi:hypothetical protein
MVHMRHPGAEGWQGVSLASHRQGLRQRQTDGTHSTRTCPAYALTNTYCRLLTAPSWPCRTPWSPRTEGCWHCSPGFRWEHGLAWEPTWALHAPAVHNDAAEPQPKPMGAGPRPGQEELLVDGRAGVLMALAANPLAAPGSQVELLPATAIADAVLLAGWACWGCDQSSRRASRVALLAPPRRLPSQLTSSFPGWNCGRVPPPCFSLLMGVEVGARPVFPPSSHSMLADASAPVV